MNMILHDFPTANILSGDTLAAPRFKDGDKQFRTYDYVVANPRFSDKTWTTGLTPANDAFQRFSWGAPPTKQGDYAYLLHIIRSMRSTGKAACILPHGVLFRGNAEGAIRQQLVHSGILKVRTMKPARYHRGPRTEPRGVPHRQPGRSALKGASETVNLRPDHQSAPTARARPSSFRVRMPSRMSQYGNGGQRCRRWWRDSNCYSELIQARLPSIA